MADDMPPEEEWRPIADQPDYEVSSLGRVRSWKKARRYPCGPQEPRILKPWTDPAGYVKVGFSYSNGRYIHQLVAEAFICPRPDGMEVDHINDIRGDNRAVNLQWLTRQENLEKRADVRATHCDRGHPFSGDNLSIRPSTGRQECKACAVIRRRAREALPPEQRSPIKHGTISAYSSRGCRCDDCKTANREYRKNKKSAA